MGTVSQDGATAYLTFTNIDLAEGRGSDRPCAVHAHLGSALAFGRTAGVGGGSTGVSSYAVVGDLDGPLTTGKQVIGAYLDGLRTWRWGVTPSQVTELSEGEKARLQQLLKQLGDLAPQPVEPPAQEEQGMVGLIWHRVPATIAGAPADSERVVGFVRIVATGDGRQLALSDPEPRVNLIRRAHPDIPRLYVSAVDFGVPFVLKESEAAWAEPVNASEMSEEERLQLIAEFTELARRAGLL